MKSIRIAGFGLAIACMLLLAACGQAKTNQSDASTFSEGVDTPCAVNYSGQKVPIDISFLAEGDSIAVISPSALPSKEQVDATIEGLKSWGYVPVEGKHVRQENRTLEDCIEDLTWALKDSSIKAVFCVRGGYGASEVFDAMLLELIAAAKKPVIGYSDITVLHSAWTRAGLPSIHASMSAAFMDLSKDCVEVEKRMLRGEIPSYTCKGSDFNKEGNAEGILIGGNLSTFTSVLGTAYDCSKTDKPYILFLEDESEDVQHVHRYLAVLKHLGVLDRASGIIFGEWTDVPTNMADYDGGSRGGAFTSMSDMISRQYVADLDIPVVFGFPAGHGEANYPLLMGAKANLAVSNGSFTLSW